MSTTKAAQTGFFFLFFFLSGGASAIAPVRVALRTHDRQASRRNSLLAVAKSTRRLGSWLEFERSRRNQTHAIEYYGDIQVGGEPFSVLFDTGSDQLVVPDAQCVSEACASHHRYDESKSKTAGSGSSDDADSSGAGGGLVAVNFAAGHAAGFQKEDQVCLGEACTQMKFVSSLEMSDDPFLHSRFDGVLGLSLSLRKNATRKTSALDALVDAQAIPAAQFGVFLAKDMYSDTSELSLGAPDAERFEGPMNWVKLSEPGYWQFSLASLSVGGEDLDLCGTKDKKAFSQQLANGTNISSFFGRMCCRTLEEFNHEQRCQFWGNSSDSTKRSRYTDSATVLKSYPDGRFGVRMHDGCVQKVPKEWISLKNGCRGDGTIQAVLDTGSSLMMGPKPLVDKVLGLLNVKENCTDQLAKKGSSFPTFGLELPGGQGTLTMNQEDYMDRVEMADGSFCWPHLMPMEETAKGAVMVLGMPFLRAFYTVFDADQHRVGFAKPKQPKAGEAVKEKNGPAGGGKKPSSAPPSEIGSLEGEIGSLEEQIAGLDGGVPLKKTSVAASVHLHGRRPGELEDALSTALRGASSSKKA